MTWEDQAAVKGFCSERKHFNEGKKLIKIRTAAPKAILDLEVISVKVLIELGIPYYRMICVFIEWLCFIAKLRKK